jgi:hypothetical protein
MSEGMGCFRAGLDYLMFGDISASLIGYTLLSRKTWLGLFSLDTAFVYFMHGARRYGSFSTVVRIRDSNAKLKSHTHHIFFSSKPDRNR